MALTDGERAEIGAAVATVQIGMLVQGQPDWRPLENVLAAERLDGFMWTGRRRVYRPGGRWRTIESYKHGITRRALHLDHNGQAYVYHGQTDSYSELPLPAAIERVYAGIEQFGATRTTPYNEEYRAERNCRLRAAGYEVIE